MNRTVKQCLVFFRQGLISMMLMVWLSSFALAQTPASAKLNLNARLIDDACSVEVNQAGSSQSFDLGLLLPDQISLASTTLNASDLAANAFMAQYSSFGDLAGLYQAHSNDYAISVRYVCTKGYQYVATKFKFGETSQLVVGSLGGDMSTKYAFKLDTSCGASPCPAYNNALGMMFFVKDANALPTQPADALKKLMAPGESYLLLSDSFKSDPVLTSKVFAEFHISPGLFLIKNQRAPKTNFSLTVNLLFETL